MGSAQVRGMRMINRTGARRRAGEGTGHQESIAEEDEQEKLFLLFFTFPFPLSSAAAHFPCFLCFFPSPETFTDGLPPSFFYFLCFLFVAERREVPPVFSLFTFQFFRRRGTPWFRNLAFLFIEKRLEIVEDPAIFTQLLQQRNGSKNQTVNFLKSFEMRIYFQQQRFSKTEFYLIYYFLKY